MCCFGVTVQVSLARRRGEQIDGSSTCGASELGLRGRVRMSAATNALIAALAQLLREGGLLERGGKERSVR